MKTNKKTGSLTKSCRALEEFGKFGSWGFTYPQGEDDEEYVPRKYSLKPLSPDYWHELPKMITPAQWARAEVNRLNAIHILEENGHISREEANFREKNEASL